MRPSKAGRFLAALLGVLYPERCLFCRVVLPEGSKIPLCPQCAPSFKMVGHICPHCESFGLAPFACSCRPAHYPLGGLFCLSFYEKNWREILLALKFRQQRSLARPLGLWLGEEIHKNAKNDFSLVVPVPLHRLRERERGYNQSALLAKNVAQALNLPYKNLLERTVATRSQTALTRQQRRENVRGAFRLKSAPARGARILLVDDIFTTGATITEAASLLVKEGALVQGAVAAFNRRGHH